MAAVGIVTDGGADLPAAVADALGIRRVQGEVRIGTEPWQGSLPEFWEAIRAGRGTPSTSPPSTEAIAATFERADAVCSVHVSAELSRAFEHARAAAAGRQVHVVDSRSMSAGTGLVAIVTAQAAATDVAFEGIGRVALRVAERAHVYALIDDIEYLRRGGRAGLVTAPAKGPNHHVLAVRGHAIPLGQHRTREGAIRDVLRHLAEQARHGVESWAVSHGDASDVEAFVERVRDVLPGDAAYITLMGTLVGTHLGPDALVVGFLSAATP